MPNDIYRWEDGGSTGDCGECTPCKHSEAEHRKRHREIAEDLHKLKELGTQQTVDTPVRAALRATNDSSTPSPSSKKERKAIKRAARIAKMPKVVSTCDIDFVEMTLHPHASDPEEAEEEKRLLEDPDIKLSLGFHKGTSNTREIRKKLIVDLRDSKHEPMVDDAELDAMIEALGIEVSSLKTAAERKVAAALRGAIKNDLIELAKEEEGTMERKAAFWRWASAKAYKRLLEHGSIWAQKNDPMTAQVKHQDEEDETAGGTIDNGSVEENAVLEAQDPTPRPRRSVEVASVTPVAVGKVKLSLNNGIAHFGTKTIARSMGMWSLLDTVASTDRDNE